MKTNTVKMAFDKWLLGCLEFFTPEFIKRMVICRLTTLSAVSLQCPIPQLKRLSAQHLLTNYAHFTENAIRKQLSQNSDPSAVKNRLYQNAFQAGQLLRARLGLTDRYEVIRLMRLLYRIINIDLQLGPQGNGIVITQCFFSQYYSSEVCQIMAALDQGLAAGLSGGERLEFRERITDGYQCCMAYWRGKPNNDIEKGDLS